MKVEFRRTGQRRYVVTVFREKFPTLEMNPAPGFDELMPHDLSHFVVEHALNLNCGIFGQLASGGNAGTFRPVVEANFDARELSRLRKSVVKKGEKKLHEGMRESQLSELAVSFCMQEWRKRSADSNTKLAQIRTDQPTGFPNKELKLSNQQLNSIFEQYEILSQKWAQLKVGEFLVVEWQR
jgi:hypothetical protein